MARKAGLPYIVRAGRGGGQGPYLDKVRQLMGLKAVGVRSAWVLVTELFAWRGIRNGKELGALVGLTPVPYDSGQSQREQGISKAGNKHVRGLIVELAWLWLRGQPGSALRQWYSPAVRKPPIIPAGKQR